MESTVAQIRGRIYTSTAHSKQKYHAQRRALHAQRRENQAQQRENHAHLRALHAQPRENLALGRAYALTTKSQSPYWRIAISLLGKARVTGVTQAHSQV